MGRRPIPLEESTTRQAILRAAAEILPRSGLANTAVEQLLTRAEVSRRTFYRMFPNLEHVLLGLYEQGVRRVFTELSKGLASTTPPSTAGFVDAYLAMSERDGALMRMLESEARRPTSLLWPLRVDLLRRLGDELRGALKLGHDVDSLLLTGVLNGLEGVLMTVNISGSLVDSERQRTREVMVRLFSVLQPRS